MTVPVVDRVEAVPKACWRRHLVLELEAKAERSRFTLNAVENLRRLDQLPVGSYRTRAVLIPWCKVPFGGLGVSWPQASSYWKTIWPSGIARTVMSLELER